MARDGGRGNSSPNDFGGLVIDELTPDQRARLGLPSGVDGVLVRQVAPGSAAAEKGIRPGDVITGIDQRPVEGLSDARAALNSARSEQGRAVIVVRRGDAQRYVALPLS